MNPSTSQCLFLSLTSVSVLMVCRYRSNDDMGAQCNRLVQSFWAEVGPPQDTWVENHCVYPSEEWISAPFFTHLGTYAHNCARIVTEQLARRRMSLPTAICQANPPVCPIGSVRSHIYPSNLDDVCIANHTIQCFKKCNVNPPAVEHNHPE